MNWLSIVNGTGMTRLPTGICAVADTVVPPAELITALTGQERRGQRELDLRRLADTLCHRGRDRNRLQSTGNPLLCSGLGGLSGLRQQALKEWRRHALHHPFVQ